MFKFTGPIFADDINRLSSLIAERLNKESESLKEIVLDISEAHDYLIKPIRLLGLMQYFSGKLKDYKKYISIKLIINKKQSHIFKELAENQSFSIEVKDTILILSKESQRTNAIDLSKEYAANKVDDFSVALESTDAMEVDRKDLFDESSKIITNKQKSLELANVTESFLRSKKAELVIYWILPPKDSKNFLRDLSEILNRVKEISGGKAANWFFWWHTIRIVIFYSIKKIMSFLKIF